MKALFILVVAVALIALLVAVVWLAVDNARLRRRMKGLDEPELWLPRAERRAHARKLLKREDSEYEQQMIARLTRVIAEGNQPNLEEGR
jgi:hypothetical protein